MAAGLHWGDYIIFAIALVGSILIGLYHASTGGKQRTTAEYFTGDRKLNFFSTSISLTVTFFSAILIIGVPAEAYLYGWSFCLVTIGMIIAVLLSVFLFIPVFYPLKLTSVNKYLELRFESYFVKILGTLSGIVNMYLYTATVFFAPATAINALTGFSTYGSIIIGSIITVIYTTLGGIKGVIYVDVFQAVLMVTGLLAVTFRSITIIGGFGTMWEVSEDWGRLDVSFDADPRVRFTFWSLVLGILAQFLYQFGIHQTAVQRYCSLPTINKAKLCLLFAIPWILIGIFTACLSGLAVFSFYATLGCDPLKGGFINNSNQLLPHFIGDVLNFPGVPGILLAAVASASLSTASSNLNSGSANIFHDLVHHFWPNMTERKNVIITKLLVVFGGVLCTLLAFMVKEIGGTIIQLNVVFVASCGGPTSAMFILGILVPFTNWIGAAAGGIGGFIFAMWLGIGGALGGSNKGYLPTTVANCTAYGREYLGIEPHLLNMTTVSSILNETSTTELPEVTGVQQVYQLSYLWVGSFSMIVALIVGLVVSLLSGGLRQKAVPGNLLHPWVRRFYDAGPDVDTLEADDSTKLKPDNSYIDEKKLGGHDNIAYITKM